MKDFSACHIPFFKGGIKVFFLIRSQEKGLQYIHGYLLLIGGIFHAVIMGPVSYTHLTLPTIA